MRMRNTNPHKEYAVQHAYLQPVAAPHPQEGKIEDGKNSKVFPLERWGPREENSPCEVEDCLF